MYTAIGVFLFWITSSYAIIQVPQVHRNPAFGFAQIVAIAAIHQGGRDSALKDVPVDVTPADSTRFLKVADAETD